jgi:uncharacterized cupin superfamily protein
MEERSNVLVRTDPGGEAPEFPFKHPLNPNSEVYIRPLAALTGMKRVAVHLGRVPPGKESFVYHSHRHEDVVYLMGGEHREFEVGLFPREKKRLIRDGESVHIVDDASLQEFEPRG